MAGWVTFSLARHFQHLRGAGGPSAILLARVLTWDDLLDERRAWDALMWFAPLLMMADELNQAGVVRILSGQLFHAMGGWPWPLALAALVTAYLYIHYSFASMTAQVTALYPSFLGAAVAAGVPPLLAALPLAYFSSLNAGHDALRHRFRAGLLRRRLCAAGRRGGASASASRWSTWRSGWALARSGGSSSACGKSRPRTRGARPRPSPERYTSHQCIAL